MTITEFLLARITEDEAEAKAAVYERSISTPNAGSDVSLLCWPDASVPAVLVGPERVLRECAAKRAIIKQHEAWPVRVSESVAPSFEATAGTESVTLRMTQRMAWLTEREYVKRFGVEPPTAPMLRTLAAVYADHPDYEQEWAV